MNGSNCKYGKYCWFKHDGEIQQAQEELQQKRNDIKEWKYEIKKWNTAIVQNQKAIESAGTRKQKQKEESVFRQLVAWYDDDKSNFMKMLVARTKKYKKTKNIDVRDIFSYSVNCKLAKNQGCPVKCAVGIFTHALSQPKGNDSAWWQSFVVAFEEVYGKM